MVLMLALSETSKKVCTYCYLILRKNFLELLFLYGELRAFNTYV